MSHTSLEWVLMSTWSISGNAIMESPFGYSTVRP